MKKELVDFKNSFTKEQQDALMQYFYDHSRLQKNGYWGIMFYMKDEDDFWKRLHSRYTGDFKRYDRLEKEKKSNSFWYHNIISEKRRRIVEDIDKKGTIKEKIILFLYRKSKNFLFYN
jgi:hypothetical protein